MRGTSAASLAAVQERFEPVLQAAGPAALDLGEQLFAVTAALDSSAALRRGLSDPSRSGADKAALAAGTLAGRFDERVVDLLRGIAESRWSRERDVADAVEEVAIGAVLAAAEARGVLEQVEDELFRLSRALIGSREARAVLSDTGTAPEQRRALAEAILAGKADEATRTLALHATTALRGRRFVPTLGWYGEIAAARRKRLVASVTTAVELDAAQTDRLGQLLTRTYGRPVQLNVTVDRDVVGGLRVQVGADVVNATILARLSDARRRLAG